MDDACKNRNTQYAGAGAQGKKKENERCSPLKCCLIKPSFQYIIFDLDTNYVLLCKLSLTDNSGSDLACHFLNPFAPLTTFLLIK